MPVGSTRHEQVQGLMQVFPDDQRLELPGIRAHLRCTHTAPHVVDACTLEEVVGRHLGSTGEVPQPKVAGCVGQSTEDRNDLTGFRGGPGNHSGPFRGEFRVFNVSGRGIGLASQQPSW